MSFDCRAVFRSAGAWRALLALLVLIPVLVACGGGESEPAKSESVAQEPVAPPPAKPARTARDPELPDPTGLLAAHVDGAEIRWQVGASSRGPSRSMWEPLSPGVIRVVLHGENGTDSNAGPLQVEFRLNGLTADSRITYATVTRWPEGPNGAAVVSKPGWITLELDSVVKKGAALELAGRFSGRLPAPATGPETSGSRVLVEEGRFRVMVPRKPYR
ncbi:hypothetical protein [Elongatibacter sediminis]|uniref:Uncharacterized protein n=1 Tax=Elongatibacter sediminis TaxID=3119006 RepID=A0AAW9R4P0_9GAMM